MEPDEQYIKWIYAQFAELNNSINTTTKINTAIKNINYELTMLGRISPYRSIVYGIHNQIIENAVAVCTIKNSNTNESAIYACIYANIQEPHSGCITYDDISYDFYSIGPSFLSKDGEYRANFSNFISYNFCKNQNQDMWNDIEEHILHTLTRNHIQLIVDIIYPSINVKKFHSMISAGVINNRLHVGMYILTWSKIIYSKYMNIVDANINTRIFNVINNCIEQDVKFMKILINIYGAAIFKKFRTVASRYYNSNNVNVPGMYLGQKYIPLNIQEVENPFNLLYAPWRELLILYRLSNLVVSNITAAFPLTNRFFFLKNVRTHLFDNPDQYIKIEHSEIAKEIVSLLMQAQTHTYRNIKLEPEDGDIVSWVNDQFHLLYNDIQESVDYVKDNILMSDVVLGIISEYVGRTLIDIFTQAHTSLYYKKQLGYPLDKGIRYFIKWIFDICYGLYIMHKMGLIHTDTHLNNITIYHLSANIKKQIQESKKQAQNLYVVGDKPFEQFLLPTNGIYAGIIDFSRCIIHPDKKHLYINKSLPERYSNIVYDEAYFIDIQINRLVNTFLHYFPPFIDKRNIIISKCHSHFNECFKLLTALDLYIFTHKIIILFSMDDPIELAEDGIKLIKDINTLAESYLTIHMNKMIISADYHLEVEKMRLPAYEILIQCFNKYNIQNASLGTLIDVFNASTPFDKYNIDTYDNYPPYLKQSIKVTNRSSKKDIKIATMETNAIEQQKQWWKLQHSHFNLVDYMAQRHREKYI